MSVEAVFPLIADLGFKKRAGDVFTIDLTPGVVGWLGLNRATQHRAPGEVEINPVVGVRFQDVERLVAECRGEKFHPYLPPTINSPLGYLMPEKKYRAWVFAPGLSESVATDMTTSIATHGLPFMRSVLDLAELERRLEGRWGFEDQLIYRRPVAALLAGDAARARSMLGQTTADMGSRNDLAAVDFKKFARALRTRLVSETPS